jgi:hypothetical protein
LLWAKAAARRAGEGKAAAEESELQAAGLGLTNSRPEALDQVRSRGLVWGGGGMLLATVEGTEGGSLTLHHIRRHDYSLLSYPTLPFPTPPRPAPTHSPDAAQCYAVLCRRALRTW